MKSEKIVKTHLPPCTLTSTAKGLLVGTYDLDKSSGNRTGSLDLFNHDLILQESVATESAILDTKVVDDIIYAAGSKGKVSIFDLELQAKSEIYLGEGLVTQIAINNDILAATLTTGELVVYDIKNEKATFRSKIHDLEAWTVSFENDANATIFTGGDDRVLSYTDLRIPYTLWKIKPHDAGVTSLLPRKNDKLWTGGYDDCINEFDLRVRRVLNSENLGGGVWRLTESPEATNVLACCMYGGLRVIDPQVFGVVKGTLTNHESMVYSGLWLDETTGITCSFYDNMLQRWKI